MTMDCFSASFCLATAAWLWAPLSPKRTQWIQKKPHGQVNPFRSPQEWDCRMHVVYAQFHLSEPCFSLYLFDEWHDSRDGVFRILGICEISPLYSDWVQQSQLSHPGKEKISHTLTLCSAGLVLREVGVCRWQKAIRNLSSPTQQIIYSNFISEFSFLFFPCEWLRKPRKYLQWICKVILAHHLWFGGVWKSFLIIHTPWFVLAGRWYHGGYFCSPTSLGWNSLICTNI